MVSFKMKSIHIICSVLFVISLLLLSGCGDKNNEFNNDSISNESYAYMTQSTQMVTKEQITHSKKASDSNYDTTESTTTKSKSWKEAYIDYIYKLDESYDGTIRYQPLIDLNGDGITDFVCRIYDDNSVEKDIVVVFDHGDIKTLSKSQILGIDNDGRVFFTHTVDDYSTVDSYAFKSGSFVFDSTGDYLDYGIGDIETAPSYNKAEMISEINRGLL